MVLQKKLDKNSQTYKNLQTAFEGESGARVRYQIFASQAKKDGLMHVANIFNASSDNEKEHAEIWFKLLHDSSVPPTTADLLTAMKNEKYEWSTMYAEFEKTAKKEGYDAISKLFHGVAEIEKFHENRYNNLLNQIKNKTMFKESKEVYWWCMNCGAFIKGKTAPSICPVCNHPQSYFVKKDIKISE
ncbi:MAG: rubrerythrin family protein [Mycoplasmoidaceae bacterium]|nr:MAG: rubrerythrin family protein [Mycoplasmoidaceae bacterium]